MAFHLFTLIIIQKIGIKKKREGGVFSSISRFFKNLLGAEPDEAISQNRNLIWVKKILSSSESQSQDIFLAAGYLHLTGYYNILEILENEGFEITLIDPETCQF